jgi:hypothetical protein
VGGKLAQLGQRLIDGAAKSLAEDFFRRFDEALQAQYPRSEAAPEAPPAQLGNGGSSAATPSWVWAVGAVALAAAAWYLTR